MNNYWEIFKKSFGEYGDFLWHQITFQSEPWYENYFYGLILVSVLVWGLEILFPWRKNQSKIRKDFWLDAFYMFVNFFLFNLVIFIAFSNVARTALYDLFGGSVDSLSLFDIQQLPHWAQLLVFFIGLDFIQWFTHVLLHKFNVLWKFHKVHHSVEEMGFAAHLRYHWMENVFYTPMKYIVFILLGNFEPSDAFIVYFGTLVIGHLNHANLNWNYGPLKYVFNNPAMHIWHHAEELPEGRKSGVNFAISLSIWDYIFRTNYIPSSGRDIKLGFANLEKFPKTFWRQIVYGWGRKD